MTLIRRNWLSCLLGRHNWARPSQGRINGKLIVANQRCQDCLLVKCRKTGKIYLPEDWGTRMLRVRASYRGMPDCIREILITRRIPLERIYPHRTYAWYRAREWLCEFKQRRIIDYSHLKHRLHKVGHFQ